MDKFADDEIKNSSISKHVHKMHDNNAFALDVMCMNSSNTNNNNNGNSNNNNNNNNEKMDDANQTTATNQKFNASIRQDSINSDFSTLTDSIQQMNTDDHRHMNSIDLRATTDDEYQSNASDEASDNNSTDNISFVSEDIVENIIVLPNNFLSDDESTNSDDVVYAYRGADFEPVPVNVDENADEETDYLEMDFDPDPASEIEQEPNQSIEPSHDFISLKAPVSPNFNAPNAFNVISNIQSNNACANTVGDLNIERTGVHKNWLAPIEVRLNGVYAEIEPISSQTNRHENQRDGVNINTENNNKIEARAASNGIESNKSLANSKENSNQISTAQQQNGQTNSSYYDNTVSLSTKKYTGTIPKTSSKPQARPIRSKTSNLDLAINGNNSLTRFESQASCSQQRNSLELWSKPGSSNQIQKRWKISDREKSASSSYCDNLGGPIETTSNAEGGNGQSKRTIYTARSMSFPNEEHLDQRSIQSEIISAIRCEPVVKRQTENDADQPLSVTFESTYCTIDIIIKALEKINSLPNVRALQEALRDDEVNVSNMNIPEYLVYASKRYCNYKAIIAAIEQSCDDVDVEFFSPQNDVLQTVHIPVRMIANRLPTNGSLTNILTIKNKRFHQMNVLGKIVNVIRRFPNLHEDLIYNEFIAIPQYYPSGFICISKKKPSTNQI